MFCPKCKSYETKVIDSRLTEDWQTIRRRRECEKCNFRFTTFERKEFVNFLVIKNSWIKELYDQTKLKRSILKAFNKRNIDEIKIEQMIGELENDWASNTKWITAKRIGRDILNKLKNIDEVAFIRFASIYKNFETAKDFMDFIKNEFE